MKCSTVKICPVGKGGGHKRKRGKIHCSPAQKRTMPQICSNVKRRRKHRR